MLEGVRTTKEVILYLFVWTEEASRLRNNGWDGRVEEVNEIKENE